MESKTDSNMHSDQADTRLPQRSRLDSIDIMRGIVIVLMALDHVRDFFHVNAFVFDPLDVDKGSMALYMTRWITNYCAPTFVFLAGVSAFLYAHKMADSRRAVSRFLFTRGLWLVFLEISIISFAWLFMFNPPAVGLQVIWAIGASMVVLSALVWLPLPIILAIGVVITVGHNLLDNITPASSGIPEPMWMLLHQQGPITLKSGFVVFIAYPLLPWIGVIAMGYGMGSLFLKDSATRFKTLMNLGLAMIAGFFLLRALGVYGDPQGWQTHSLTWQTVGDFLDVRKYPPSLLYILITLGPVFVLLPWLERSTGKVSEMFATFGRVPLFFYVLHLYLVHGLMMALGVAMGYPAATFGGVLFDPTQVLAIGWGFSLPVVYGVWLLVLVMLYPACRWFGQIKRQRRDWWLSYL